MSEAERKSALKHERSQNVLLSSPLQAPGLKAAKVEEGGENGNVHVSMGGGVASLPQVPSFPKVGASSGPINLEGVAGELFHLRRVAVWDVLLSRVRGRREGGRKRR
jgi:hypothetical protein